MKLKGRNDEYLEKLRDNRFGSPSQLPNLVTDAKRFFEVALPGNGRGNDRR